jgi:hypothetical protein
MAAQSTEQLSTQQSFDFDIADGFFSDGEYALSPRYKKRRANETSISSLTDRINNRFPSFSQKWRLRKKTSSANSLASDGLRDITTSRAASSRSSSISASARPGGDKSFDLQLPPTPTASLFDTHEDSLSASPIDIEKANSEGTAREENFATTPLLPPLMTDVLSSMRNLPMQSPLQSPSVAEANNPWESGNVTPIDAITTPQLAGIPSPPLSTKPSISSFHRSSTSRPNYLIPSADIPPIHIADVNDEWANKLGHANFCIHPEPYVPDVFDLEACRQLRATWDLARCNYTKHLVRTGEHYGVTSKTYKLTEEKWLSIDAIWRKNNDVTITNTVANGSDAFATLKHTTLGDDSTNNVMTRIPSLNDPRSEGKFPQMGDEDIVGPMVQVAAQLQRTPTKKGKFFKFFAEKFPASLARS